MCNASNEFKHNNVSIYLSIRLHFVPTIAEFMVDHNQVIYLFIIHDIIVMVFSWLNGCLENYAMVFIYAHFIFEFIVENVRACVHVCVFACCVVRTY